MARRFAPGAIRYAVLPLLLGAASLAVSPVLVALGVAVSGSVLAFYRDPDRQVAPTGVASPADGRVSVIREEDGCIRVGVFMNVTDVHVNRAPLAGTVRSISHRPGANKPAFCKDSDRNERLHVDCGDFSVVLIAGWFARRIHPYVDEGDQVAKGERVGHISFGSRADVILPESYSTEDLLVEEGDRVYAGKSAIADRSDGDETE